MFREILTELIKDNEWAKLQKPCDESELAKAEKYVGYSLPNELKALLRETDGDQWFLLSVKEIIENVERNRRVMAEYFEEGEFEESILQQTDVVITTVIVFFLMVKPIHQRFIFGSMSCLKFVRLLKI